MFLPDINLWLALTFDVHLHHTAAKGRFESQARESFAFCRFTQQGFLRLASNPKALKESAVPLQEGWRLYDTILSDSRISFLAERLDPGAHSQGRRISARDRARPHSRAAPLKPGSAAPA